MIRRDILKPIDIHEIVVSAAFASIAIVLTIAKVVIPFPPLPYLKFEIAEIPVIISLLIASFRIAITTCIIYWFVLLIVGEFTPIGPTMKFLSTLSTIMGIYIGEKIFRSSILELSKFRQGLIVLIAILFRCIVMTIANTVVLIVFLPGFLDFAVELLRSIGVVVEENFLAKLSIVLLFTALFNTIHTVMDIYASIPISKYIIRSPFFKGLIKRVYRSR